MRDDARVVAYARHLDDGHRDGLSSALRGLGAEVRAASTAAPAT